MQDVRQLIVESHTQIIKNTLGLWVCGLAGLQPQVSVLTTQNETQHVAHYTFKLSDKDKCYKSETQFLDVKNECNLYEHSLLV